jgi:hypothetical protein
MMLFLFQQKKQGIQLRQKLDFRDFKFARRVEALRFKIN